MNIAYKVPWIHDVIGAAESLVVKNDSGVTDFTGLVGKKVGTPFGSTAHYSLLAALELNGVDPTKVKIVDLQPPDILAAWQRGDIDAAYVWNPTLAELKKDGTVLITSEELAKQGKLTADLAIVTNDVRRASIRTPCRPGSTSRTGPSSCTSPTRRPPRRGRRPPAQHHRRRGPRADEGPHLPRRDASRPAPTTSARPDAPGKLADNLESAAAVPQDAGQRAGRAAAHRPSRRTSPTSSSAGRRPVSDRRTCAPGRRGHRGARGPAAAERGSARPERIDVRGVTHVFGKDKRSTPALAGVDLTVEPGEFVCLVGLVGLRQDDAAQADRRLLHADRGHA